MNLGKLGNPGHFVLVYTILYVIVVKRYRYLYCSMTYKLHNNPVKNYNVQLTYMEFKLLFDDFVEINYKTSKKPSLGPDT